MTQTVTGTGQYDRLSMCAIVLEDEPVGADSRLEFESWPGELEEVYSVNEYREMGGDRMSQPSHVAYRGGNWQPFTLTLTFRAGLRKPGQQQNRAAPQVVTDAEIQQLLIEMESKVRWCQALCFPLERRLYGSSLSRATADINRQLETVNNPTRYTNEQIRNTSLRRNDPPIVLIVFGSWWVQRCYAKNVSIKWQGPWHPETVRPHGAEVSISFMPIKSTYPTWNLIRFQAGAGGYDQANQDPLITGVVSQERLRDSLRARNNALARSGG